MNRRFGSVRAAVQVAFAFPAGLSALGLLYSLILMGDPGGGFRILVPSLFALGLLACVVASLLLGSSLGKSLKSTLEGVSSVTEGEADLARRIPVPSGDEVGRIARSFNIFLAKLHTLVKRLKEVAERNSTASDGFASGAEELSATVHEISASMANLSTNGDRLDSEMSAAKMEIGSIRESLAEIVALMKSQAESVEGASMAVRTLSSSVDSVREDTREKAALAFELENRARESGSAVSATLSAFKEISASVEGISDVASVIAGISSRTNLLAMNAAIEAAHAGKSGAGFAVVADEIRKLAESTAVNTKTIRSSIASVVSRAREASGLSEQTEAAFTQVADGIERISKSMNGISVQMDVMRDNSTRLGKALDSLVSATGEVGKAGASADNLSNGVALGVGTVADLSGENARALAEMSVGLHEVNEAVVELARLGADNARSVDDLEASIMRFKTIDTSSFKASDGRPLVWWTHETKEVPSAPKDPQAWPEKDSRRWYKYEYAGWGVKKLPMPESPADGAQGKRVVCIVSGSAQDHPYMGAYCNGVRKVAEAFGIKAEFSFCSFNAAIQIEKSKEAARTKPDMAIVLPASASESIHIAKLFYEDGIPLIFSNTVPEEESFKYCATWTGPDDWGQMRALAGRFAEKMGNRGGYVVLQHVPGASPFYSRTWGPVTELAKIAPGMTCLETAALNFDPAQTTKVLLEWLKKYGDRLKGIISADDMHYGNGIREAMERSGRKDLICIAAGASKVGLDLVRRGILDSITYQSAEGDGALAMKAAVDWFSGLTLDPMIYLPFELIHRDNVERYMPGQW